MNDSQRSNPVPSSGPILSVESLTRRFGQAERPVIDNLSFSIARGGRVTLFAPTGAGKSTLINILSGVDREYEGKFTLGTERVSTVFQEPRLFPYMTVEENVFLPLRVRRAGVTAVARERCEAWLAVCGLRAYARRYPHELSGGMKQKVALIRGFITEPEFVMLDESFRSLDWESKQAIAGHIRSAYPCVSLLFVTHVLEEAPLLTESLLRFRTNRLAQHDASRLDAVFTEAMNG
jgi:ABC-type nitrate/sulfonate/bicarbonate transport system ATPase subunit